ncbi:glycosyltransferase family 2 protein [Bacillus cereus]|uniref:glycosyltransferase family 2 protein n=1 Tax=Bacillus cereus TaxID=1396 RepID=UPI0024055435|nr:glycosyltransferase family 2 protein [Bacillus cereus]MDF9507870.1 glycosyltransferase family 2 protein [Bacillus cereus]MDF9596633.1 glycosyltransferase family 2 protein [Bacillus cereus]MDF9609784.1 glycosyltransferase family 2 protein [Bacillus cereus]MDF9659999.1 glycosyltransferase family 2 protein [Bacillus cereus]
MISVIIPTFNKADYLKLTLASLVNQSFSTFEIVIVNNGGNDDTSGIVASFNHLLDINYVELPKNVGRPEARNIGVKHSRGDILIFIDDDRILDENFVMQHKNTLSTQDEKTLVFGNREKILSIWKAGNIGIHKDEFINYARKNRSLVKSFQNKKEEKLFDTNEIINNFDEIITKFQIQKRKDVFMYIVDAFKDRLDSCYFLWVVGSSANVSCFKSFFEKVGGYDEYYVRWGLEDLDLFYRCYLEGSHFKFNKKACNYHQVHLRGETEHEDLYNNLIYFCEKFRTEEIKLFLDWRNGDISIEEANEKIHRLKQDKSFDSSKKVYKNFEKELSCLKNRTGLFNYVKHEKVLGGNE